jgi:hypothetical protein
MSSRLCYFELFPGPLADVHSHPEQTSIPPVLSFVTSGVSEPVRVFGKPCPLADARAAASMRARAIFPPCQAGTRLTGGSLQAAGSRHRFAAHSRRYRVSLEHREGFRDTESLLEKPTSTGRSKANDGLYRMAAGKGSKRLASPRNAGTHEPVLPVRKIRCVHYVQLHLPLPSQNMPRVRSMQNNAMRSERSKCTHKIATAKPHRDPSA